MDDTWVLLVGLVIGFSSGCWFQWRHMKETMIPKPKELPFRWECNRPGCVYKCSASNINVMMGMADKHIEETHA